MGYLMYPKVFTDYATATRLRPGAHPAHPHLLLRHGTGRGDRGRDRPRQDAGHPLQAIGETNEEGEVRVFFELNGQPRTIRVPDRKAGRRRPNAQGRAGNPNHVGAPMPGVVATVAVQVGQRSSRATCC
jgi:pyruvate carboxylase